MKCKDFPFIDCVETNCPKYRYFCDNIRCKYLPKCEYKTDWCYKHTPYSCNEWSRNNSKSKLENG